MSDFKVSRTGTGTVRVECPPLSQITIDKLRVVVDLHELVRSQERTLFEFAEQELPRFEEIYALPNPDEPDFPVPIVCYHDYISPFCYVSIQLNEELERKYDVVVDWRPFELVPPWSAFPGWWFDPPASAARWTVRKEYVESVGLKMLDERPPHRAYMRPLMLATEFARDEGRVKEFMKAVSRAYFEHGVDLRRWKNIEDIAKGIGLSAQRMTDAVFSGSHVARLEAWRSDALSKAVFGTPTWLIGDEMIWGRKPVDALEHALKRVGAKLRR